MTLTRGCCVLSCRISKSLSSNKKMRMKSKIFTSFLLAAVLLSGCKKDDPAPDKATLSVSPQTAIAFTAAATETFTVKVVTNQPAWKAESSQSWCKVAAGEGQFTVSADPNTSETAPTPAVITVTAGSEKATIDVTQAAAGKEQYPDTEAKLKQAIAKVWTFAESSNYVSLEFTTDGLYTFLSKTPFTLPRRRRIRRSKGSSRKNLRRETAPSNTVTMRIGGCRRLRFHRAA